MALCWSLDKIGPLVRSSEDAVPVLAALNGADAGDPCSRDHGFAYDGTADVSGMRVAYDPAWFADKDATDPDRAALAAMRGLGVTMVERSLPDLPYATLLTQLEAEAAAAFSELTLSGDDQRMRWQADAAWPNTWRRARFLTAVDLVQTDRFRRRVMHEAERFFDGVDAVIGPNFAGSMLLVTNFTGHPCLTVRAGFRELATRPSAFDRPGSATAAKHRVPHNVSLWAGLYREGTLLALGRALEQRLDVQAIRPDLT
jgi:Asp-tRNA(Asn)/Glu-tRNA(Gln) amidotransferase A subunit family amidase